MCLNDNKGVEKKWEGTKKYFIKPKTKFTDYKNCLGVSYIKNQINFFDWKCYYVKELIKEKK